MNKKSRRIKTASVILGLIMAVSMVGCSSKEEEKPVPADTVNTQDTSDGGADDPKTPEDSSGNAETPENSTVKPDIAEATEDSTVKPDTAEATEDSTVKSEAAEDSKNAAPEPVEAGNPEDGKEASGDKKGGSDFFDISEVQAALDAGTVTIEELAQRFGMPADQLQAYLNMAANQSEEMTALAEMYKNAGTSYEVGELVLPAASSEFSGALASQALTLCTGHAKEGQAAVLEANGFEILLQNNYDKAYSDPSHTCAYTVGSKKIDFYGTERTLIFVAVRGTNGGEWISNFNYAESHSDDTVYAENFMYAAQSISVELVPTLISNPDAIVMVSGHSRGAAAANLLGMLLNETRGSENVYCYTFATPNTYRGAEPKEGCDNIFNIINPCDVVTKMPLTGLGYRHVGTDIILPGDPDEIEHLDNSMNVMYEAAPSIKSYYEDRHSLTGPGLSEDGMTAYEVMLAMASGMTGITTEENGGVTIQQLYSVLAENPGSADSDLAPLFGILQKVIGADGSYGVSIFGQHMPATYQQLLGMME